MLEAFKNSFKIPDLRKRIIYMLLIILVVRLGSAIVLPGVNPAAVHGWVNYMQGQGGAQTNLGTLLNVFSGGATSHCALFALGIMPYISASIMVQLLSAVVPRLSKLAREEGGRAKINQWTRFLTIAICIVQGLMMAKGMVDPKQNFMFPSLAEYLSQDAMKLVPNPSAVWYTMTVLIMTVSVMLLMWLGELITERGIGNGTSLIISANIVSALPGALVTLWKTYITGPGAGPLGAAKVLGLIALTQAARKVTIQYAKRQIGRKVMGGQSTHLPLKINYSGVMPIIFAQAILLFPAMILSYFKATQEWGSRLQGFMNDQTNHWFYLIDACLIFFFSYFWVATMFQPTQISEDLKKNGGYIPGIRPGKPTADFLDHTMTRLTFAGAVFLTLIAVAPRLMNHTFNLSNGVVTQFFGGTSVLILVGVLLDMMRQMETFLLQRNYDGFLSKGKIRGRGERPGAPGALQTGANLTPMIVLGAVVAVLGAAWYIMQWSGK
jgi:preprotein translocase subunit SecY